MHPFSDLQVLWRQFLKFKETELPAKEADKNRSKHIFKSFEVSFLTSSNESVSKSHEDSCSHNVLKGILHCDTVSDMPNLQYVLRILKV